MISSLSQVSFLSRAFLRKSLRLSGALCLFSAAHLTGYAPELAYVGAGVGGSLTGVVAYSALEGTIFSQMRAPLALLSSGLVGYGLFKFLHQFTPAGRFKRAEDRVIYVEGFYLAKNSLESDAAIVQAVNSIYIARSWPLVSAFDDLVRCLTKLDEAVALAQAASQEDATFKEAVAELNADIQAYSKNAERALAAIKKNPDYLKQVEQAREEQRRRQEMAIQQQMANAQMSSANAQWYNASANHKIADAQLIQANNGRRW